jgi:hypothetical protein
MDTVLQDKVPASFFGATGLRCPANEHAARPCAMVIVVRGYLEARANADAAPRTINDDAGLAIRRFLVP